MIVHKSLKQGSEEWLKFRLGKASASEAKKVLTATGRASKSALGYMRKLARECVCEDPMVFFGNKHTEWGHEHEPEARELFIAETGIAIEEFGFLTRADKIIGASPDGLHLTGLIKDSDHYLVEPEDCGLEVKCPQVDTHVGYVIDGVLPDEYKLQVHWSLAASGLSHWYFMSYFPGLNPLIIRVDADSFTEKVKEAQDQFIVDYAPERERVFNAVLPSRKKAYNAKPLTRRA